ncbi:MAG: carboxy terminal-processing peptidase [Saprospiraceae bacterium]|nr:carboxy terminal-processing peptidase [Saprospiraceae bacterium]
MVPDIVLPDNWLYVETGEKEEDFPMEWTQIDPVPYGQKVYSLGALPKIKEMANSRIKGNEVFQKIDQRAKRLKELRDDSEHTLNLDEYLAENKKLDEEDNIYTKLFEKEVLTSIQNLPVDMAGLQSDESKKARNEEWLKGVKKDVYLLETLNIMHDLLTIR